MASQHSDGKEVNEKWRMCINYIYLNKACPMDSYPLPSIDRLIDRSTRFPILCFLDAYSGYNQIVMFKQDEEKIAFMTNTTNYCYSVMLFRLKNSKATYQRLMDKKYQLVKEKLGGL